MSQPSSDGVEFPGGSFLCANTLSTSSAFGLSQQRANVSPLSVCTEVAGSLGLRCSGTALVEPIFHVLLRTADHELHTEEKFLCFLHLREDKGQFSAHELHDHDMLDIWRCCGLHVHQALVCFDDAVDFGNTRQGKFDDAAVALVHLQGLQVIHNLAMDHRVVLVGARLGQVPTSVQIQRKFPEESQENVSLLVFLIAFLQGEVLGE
mmetsp:Transcript_47624/g.103828  ORF Transcript_47624/g.103828 Transcript_47624/m.103828 type:complete len:207 (-) Transcript_47624:262-882(-)